jgi:hypothetical protein
MKKQHLLPHSWQWVGLAALFLGLIPSLKSFIPFLLSGSDYRQIGVAEAISQFGFLIMMPLSAVILCFSREKIEDERIAELRMKSLATTAIIYVILLIIGPLKGIILGRLFSHRIISNLHLLFGHGWWMLFIYLLIFKISYWVQNRRYSNEK